MLVPEAYRERAEEVVSLSREGESWSGEFEVTRKDGALVPVMVTNTPLYGDDGDLVGIIGVSMDITERKVGEEARAHLVAIVESSDYAIMGITLEGIVNSWNSGAERLFGYRVEEIIGRPVYLIVPPERHDEVRRVVEMTGRGERVGRLETVRVAKGGRRVDISLAISPIRGPAGNVLGVSEIARDITGRREAEEVLRKSEERHRSQSRDLALLHQVRSALAHELDPATVYRTVVEATAEAYGYTQVSAYHLEGDGLLLRHQVGYHQVIERIPVSEGVCGRAVRTGRPILLEDVRDDPAFLGAIGGITSEICVPLLDEGEAVGVFNVESTGGVRLTTDDLALMVALGEHVSVAVGRAQLHARVRGSEEHFRSLVQNSSDVITLAGADGTVRYVSPAVEGVLGYRPEERVGRSAFDLVHPDDAEGVKGALVTVLRTPGVPLCSTRCGCDTRRGIGGA